MSLSGPVCFSAEREVQAEAAAAGGFQQRGRCGEMLQKGLQPPAWHAGSDRRAQLPERSRPSHCFRLAHDQHIGKKIKAYESILIKHLCDPLRAHSDYLLSKCTGLSGLDLLLSVEILCIHFMSTFILAGGWLLILFQLCWRQELQNRLHSCLMKPWRVYRDWSPSSTQPSTMLCTWAKWLRGLKN